MKRLSRKKQHLNTTTAGQNSNLFLGYDPVDGLFFLLFFAMLRHCPITRFSSSGARRKMPNVTFGKETLQVPLQSQTFDLADTKDVAKEQLPPQKVLKIFSINIIAQGLPFCRRRVSIVCSGPILCFGFSLHRTPKMSKVILSSHPSFTLLAVFWLVDQSCFSKIFLSVLLLLFICTYNI